MGSYRFLRQRSFYMLSAILVHILLHVLLGLNIHLWNVTYYEDQDSPSSGVHFLVKSYDDHDSSWILPLPPKMRTEINELHVNGESSFFFYARQGRMLLENNIGDKNSLLGHITITDITSFLAQKTRCLVTCNLTHLASGWTKAVYTGLLQPSSNGAPGRPVAVKTVNKQGRDVRLCIDDVMRSDAGRRTSLSWSEAVARCQQKASDKIAKEAYIISAINSSHIVPLIAVCGLPHTSSGSAGTRHRQRDDHDSSRHHDGHCHVSTPSLPSDLEESRDHASIVTSLGSDVDLIRLLQMSWEDRLRVVYDVTSLLYDLAHAPFGSVVINDFRRQQFVLVDGSLLLSDVDDIGFGDPSCHIDQDCTVHDLIVDDTMKDYDNISIRSISCTNGQCEGFNELHNVLSASREFVSIIALTRGAPSEYMRHLASELAVAYSGRGGDASWRTEELLRCVNELVAVYSSGEYTKTRQDVDRATYVKYEATDLSGLNDYRCSYTLTTPVCTISVHDVTEGMYYCDNDPMCHGFVLNQHHRTWTGRYLIHLKNNVTSMTHNWSLTFYAKRRNTV